MKDDELENSKLDFRIDVEIKRYDKLSQQFSESRNRRLVLLSAELVIFTYLFSDLQAIVPAELYGIIFFAIGVLSGVASLSLSFYHCRPTIWPDPIGKTEKAMIDAAKSEVEWKRIVENDYYSASTECKRILSSHSKTLKFSLFFFVISTTILLIIKFF